MDNQLVQFDIVGLHGVRDYGRGKKFVILYKQITRLKWQTEAHWQRCRGTSYFSFILDMVDKLWKQRYN